MITAVCCVPVSPVRTESRHKSEMSTQLLFGEVVEVVEKGDENWIRIRCLYDYYEGWITQSHVTEIPESVAMEKWHLASDWANEIVFHSQPMFIPLGSDLRGLKNGQAEWGKYSWSFKGNHIDPVITQRNEKTVIRLTHRFLNTPYLWGGRSVFGIDCSGFSQVIYKCLDVPLLRDAYQQATQGEGIGFLQEVKCGDLAFFDNDEGRITHVGILLNEHEIIHSSGKVRIDRIDSQGILNTGTQERTHRLRLIKRYF
ncbi:MAG: C40 family peptidase [Chitinophagaceae bacterium]|nr:C40 family peptidase [Chitinophagaceae bacterium]